MKSSRIQFWIYAMPILSLLLAGSSIGFQYYSASRAAAQLQLAKAEIDRLLPKSNESYDPSAHDKPV